MKLWNRIGQIRSKRQRWIFIALFFCETWKYLLIVDAYLIDCFSHSVIRFRSITCKHELENILSACWLPMISFALILRSFVRSFVSLVFLSLIPHCWTNHFTSVRTPLLSDTVKSSLLMISLNFEIDPCISYFPSIPRVYFSCCLRGKHF